MNGFLDTQHGMASLLASIVIILTLQLITRIGQFLWDMMKKKNEISEQSIQNLTAALSVNTQAVEKLERRIIEAEQVIYEIPKFKQDLRRVFFAVKYLSGDKWESIYKKIKDDESEISNIL